MRTILLGLVFCLTGCADASPPGFNEFIGCLSGPIRAVETGEPRAEFECEVRNSLLLVAMPGRPVSVDELVAAGVSKEIADILDHAANRTAQWCAVVEFPQDPNPPDRSKQLVAQSDCVDMDGLEIDDVIQTRAPRVRLVLERSPGGHARLKVFEPTEK